MKYLALAALFLSLCAFAQENSDEKSIRDLLSTIRSPLGQSENKDIVVGTIMRRYRPAAIDRVARQYFRDDQVFQERRDKAWEAEPELAPRAAWAMEYIYRRGPQLTAAAELVVQSAVKAKGVAGISSLLIESPNRYILEAAALAASNVLIHGNEKARLELLNPLPPPKKEELVTRLLEVHSHSFPNYSDVKKAIWRVDLPDPVIRALYGYTSTGFFQRGKELAARLIVDKMYETEGDSALIVLYGLKGNYELETATVRAIQSRLAKLFGNPSKNPYKLMDLGMRMRLVNNILYEVKIESNMRKAVLAIRTLGTKAELQEHLESLNHLGLHAQNLRDRVLADLAQSAESEPTSRLYVWRHRIAAACDTLLGN